MNMKAAIVTKYGPPEVVVIGETARPTPKDREVLIRVRATNVTTADWRIRSSIVPSPFFWIFVRMIFGFTKPRKPVLGVEGAGVVEAIGKRVGQFKVGDEVFFATGMRMGAHAEYCCVAESGPIAMKPKGLSFEEAATLCFAGCTSLFYLRDLGKIQKGQKVLINGASGAIGTCSVQLAKIFGAHVTGICSSANVGLVQSLGADRVIDYTKEDFTRCGETFDLILDTVGKINFNQCKPLLTDQGRFLPVVATFTELMQSMAGGFSKGKKVMSGVSIEKPEDLAFLKSCIESGRLKPVVQKVFRFDEIVDAYRIVDSGHKKGSVVLTVST